MAAHGTQKLLGWFEGPGLGGVRSMLESFGFRLPALMAVALALTECAGLLFALGLLTPFACLGIAVVMLNAIALVRFEHGLWAGKGGHEVNRVLLTVAGGVSAT